MARLALLGLVLVAAGLRAASNDGNVEWDGVLSLPDFRSPHHPGKDRPFTVELRVFKGDIASARVRSWDGAERKSDMVWVGNDPGGTYDFWRGSVAGTSKDFLYYRFELTDGADTDHYNALGMWGDAPPRGDFLLVTTPLGSYPLGATPALDGSGTVFRVWAPGATTAAVAGTFNNWSASAHPLRNVQGFWEGLVPPASAGARYKLVLDGDVWRTDPRARRQSNSVGDSMVVDPRAFAWTDAGFRIPDIEDLVIYELHVGSFSGEGDGVSRSPGSYRDVVDAHLDHLVSLGVNCIELMPVGEFAGDRSWGYNPAFQYAPESAYGAPDDLKHLVDRCHRRGIAVILDVVYNHMGPSDLAGNLLEYDGDEIYFYPEGNGWRETPWGPRPDYGRVEVRDFLRENARYWLEELHLDGLRIDATSFIKVNAEGWALLREIVEHCRAVKPRAILIAEQLPNDPALSRPIALGGAGYDAQWHDAFHDSLRAAIGAAAFGDPNMGALAAAINHFDYPSRQVVNYIESHDEAAHQGRVSRLADSADPDSPFAYGRGKVAAGLVLLASGIPMLLQGQEWLEDRPFGDSEDKRIQWRYRTEHADFLLYVRDAVRLRRILPALRADASQNVFHVNEGANVIAFHRWVEGQGKDLVVVASLNNGDLADYALGFPRAGTWHEVLNSEAGAYGGSNVGNGGRVEASGPAMHGFAQSARIRIPARGFLAFAVEPLAPRKEFLRGDANGDGAVDISDPVRTLLVLFQGAPAGDCPAASDANGDGEVDISDAAHVLTHLFRSGPAPGAPWPDCGEGASDLPCARACI